MSHYIPRGLRLLHPSFSFEVAHSNYELGHKSISLKISKHSQKFRVKLVNHYQHLSDILEIIVAELKSYPHDDLTLEAGVQYTNSLFGMLSTGESETEFQR